MKALLCRILLALLADDIEKMLTRELATTGIRAYLDGEEVTACAPSTAHR